MLSAYRALLNARLGRETRNHQDIDIAIFREDQFELRRHLANWKWEKAVNGTLVCSESNEWLELPIHEVRASSGAAAAYVRLKKDLAQRFRNDRERYTEAKTDFIRSFL
jgi:GrpB protein